MLRTDWFGCACNVAWLYTATHWPAVRISEDNNVTDNFGTVVGFQRGTYPPLTYTSTAADADAPLLAQGTEPQQPEQASAEQLRRLEALDAELLSEGVALSLAQAPEPDAATPAHNAIEAEDAQQQAQQQAQRRALQRTLSPPEDFCCFITQDVMTDPVMLVETGRSYECAEIERWFAVGNSRDPTTNAPLQPQAFVPNHALRKSIERWREKYGGGGAATAAGQH